MALVIAGEGEVCMSQVTDDGKGDISFLIDVNGDLFGSTHNAVVFCGGRLSVVQELRKAGSGKFSSVCNGMLYAWTTQCGSFEGVHMRIELRYAVPIFPGMPFQEVARKLTDAGVDYAVVMGEQGETLGFVHVNDIVATVATAAPDARLFPDVLAQHVMRPNPAIVSIHKR